MPMPEGAAALAARNPPGASRTEATSPAAFRASGLIFEIAGRRLVDDVELSLSPASLTAVMGPNGAGKSLLLRLMHGLLEPSGGTLTWGGEAMSPALRRSQAMVFQRPVLLRRSVAANVDFVLALQGRVLPERRDALLERVKLLDRARQPARLLSGGEQQRLALARALALGPRVLFLDEPTASLDPASAAMIEEIVADEHARGTKVVIVTHSAAQARRLAGDVVFMSAGRVLEHTPARRFFEAPSSPEAEAFLAGRHVL